MSNVEMTFAGMTSKVFSIPNYSEVECCLNVIQNFPVIRVVTDGLEDDLSNLQHAIEANFIEIPKCTRCKEKPKIERNFGNHVFVEVGVSCQI